MIVHDFDVNGTDARPHKADAPLVIDTNTVLTLSVIFQGLKAVARRGLQKVESLGGFKLSELALCNVHEGFELSRALALVQRLRAFALERLDHAAFYYAPRNSAIDLPPHPTEAAL